MRQDVTQIFATNHTYGTMTSKPVKDISNRHYKIMPNQKIDNMPQIKIPSDGNCCFEAVLQVFKHEYPENTEIEIKSHEELRQLVCKNFMAKQESFNIKISYIENKLKNTSFTLDKKDNLYLKKDNAKISTENERTELSLEIKNDSELKDLLNIINAARKLHVFKAAFKNVVQYAKTMGELGVYGGQPELMIMSEILTCKIIIHTINANVPTIIGLEYEKEIHIAHVALDENSGIKNHYNILANKTWKKNIPLADSLSSVQNKYKQCDIKTDDDLVKPPATLTYHKQKEKSQNKPVVKIASNITFTDNNPTG